MPLIRDFFQQTIANLGNNLPNISNNSNKTVYLKDSRVAANQYNIGPDPSQIRAPRSKFLYFVNFVSPLAENTKKFNDFSTGISFLVNKIKKPTINIELKTLNQYNKKRLIQTKFSYDDIDLQIVDTYDNRGISLIKNYLQFYFGDFLAEKPSNWNNDVIAALYQYINGTSPLNALDWGFNPPIVGTNVGNNFDFNSSYYFSEINLIEFGGGYYQKYTFVNPKISNITLGESSYFSNDINIIQISFKFEGLLILDNSSFNNSVLPVKKLSNEESEQFGFNYSQFNNVKFPVTQTQQKSPTSTQIQEKPSVFFSNNNTRQVENFPVSPQPSRSSLNSNLIPGWLNFSSFGNNVKTNKTSSVGFNLSPGFNPDADNRVFDLFI